MSTPTKKLERKQGFMAVPIIADNPRYGWHIVGLEEFSSQKKCNNAIRRLRK